jgi:signal transduction histidine kinase
MMYAGQLLLECAPEGDVLWMNAPARRRLGSPRNLLETIPESGRPKASAALEPGGDREVACVYHRPGTGETIPLRLRRLLRLNGRVFFLASPAQRASDGWFHERILLDPALPFLNHLPELERHCVRLEAEVAGRSAVRARGTGARIAREVERERTRLARILHAGAGQTLAGIKVNLELIGTLGCPMTPRVAECLERIRNLCDETIEQVRGVSHALNPPRWQGMELRQALERLWISSGIPEKYEGILALAPLPAEPSHWIRIAVYRFCQEALANVVRHAGASRVGLRMHESGGRILVTVEDDGCGIPPQNAAGPNGAGQSGIGLTAMREQASELGGEVRIQSEPGATRVEISLPYCEVA